jgi:hypothetical protein
LVKAAWHARRPADDLAGDVSSSHLQRSSRQLFLLVDQALDARALYSVLFLVLSDINIDAVLYRTVYQAWHKRVTQTPRSRFHDVEQNARMTVHLPVTTKNPHYIAHNQ